MRIEIDGREVDAAQLWSTASAYGHFTAMQVRGGRTRGLALHLDRLEAATAELFDSGLDRNRVVALIRHALGGHDDASVRVYIFESAEEPAIMVTVKPSGGVSTPQRLQSVRYERPDAHLKHLATGQSYYSRLARRNGFDDALLTGDEGVVSESAIANIVHDQIREPGQFATAQSNPNYLIAKPNLSDSWAWWTVNTLFRRQNDLIKGTPSPGARRSASRTGCGRVTWPLVVILVGMGALLRRG